jgi:hypothetical protein
MWRFIKTVAIGAGILSAPVIVLSTKSIPEAIKAADGSLYTNIKWICDHTIKCSPSPNLASAAADHFTLIVGLGMLAFAVVVGVLWLIEKFTTQPIRIICLEEAEDTPTQGNVALWLWVKNRSGKKIEDVVATLVKITPYPPAFPIQALPPIRLSTKERLEDYRSGKGPLWQGGFTLRAGQPKPVEVAWIPKTNALQWYVTRSTGDAEFILGQTYILTIEISGGPRIVTARIELALTDFEQGAWEAKLLKENPVARYRQRKRALQQTAEGNVVWGATL